MFATAQFQSVTAKTKQKLKYIELVENSDYFIKSLNLKAKPIKNTYDNFLPAAFDR